MAKKTYRTYRLKGYQILAKDADGNRVEIVFRGGIQIDSTAKFTTTSKALQEILESSASFNKTYYLESVQEDKEEAAKMVEESAAPVEDPQKPLTDVKDIKRFHNIVEMRNAMAELGFDGVQSLNYQQLKSVASKAGYDFQISKA